jgi:ABC-type transport system involved in cytochrome c biogenesis ATPase subunit
VHWQGQPIRRQRETYAQALLYLGHLGGLKDELTPVENLRIEADLAGTPGVDDARMPRALAPGAWRARWGCRCACCRPASAGAPRWRG